MRHVCLRVRALAGVCVSVSMCHGLSVCVSLSVKIVTFLGWYSVMRNVTFIGLLAWYSDMREDQNVFTVSPNSECPL